MKPIGPDHDLPTSLGRAGLSQRQVEREVRRPAKPLQTFGYEMKATMRAEDWFAVTSRQKQLEDYARSIGFEVTVGASGLNEEAA